MKIVFLDAAKPDLRWFKRYYMVIFPEGKRNADQQYHALLKLLKSSPMIGGLRMIFGMPASTPSKTRHSL